jgi:hypothetical protein
MKTKLLTRIASGLMLFHLLGHCIGHAGWKTSPEPAQKAIVDQMNGQAFPFMGAVRSLGDYYEGYGWICSVALLFFAIVLWLVSGAAAEARSLVSKILWTLAVCLLLMGVLELRYFFPFAAGTTLLACLLTFWAALQLRIAAPNQ